MKEANKDYAEERLRKLKLANAIASKSKLTMKDVMEIDKKIKRGIAKSYGLIK